MKLNIDWFNCNEKTKAALTTILADAHKANGMNPFAVDSAFVEDGRMQVVFTDELAAYKFATHCHFLKPFVKIENGKYFNVHIRINTTNDGQF